MTKDEELAMDLALEALEQGIDGQTSIQMDKAITAIKQARSAPVLKPVAWVEYETGNHTKRPPNCGTSYCSCIECVMEPAPVQVFDHVNAARQGLRDAQNRSRQISNLINCGTCGYPLAPEERTSLIERDGVMVKPAPVQEPVAYLCENAVGHKYFRWKKPSSEFKPIALYTTPPAAQRQWVGLTDEEIDKTYETQVWDARRSYARAIEAKLKEKNT